MGHLQINDYRRPCRPVYNSPKFDAAFYPSSKIKGVESFVTSHSTYYHWNVMAFLF